MNQPNLFDFTELLFEQTTAATDAANAAPVVHVPTPRAPMHNAPPPIKFFIDPANAKNVKRMRGWADSLQPKIDHAMREMTQNHTPKRGREYQSRLHDGRNMERLQKALRALSDAYENNSIAPSLKGLGGNREVIAAMVHVAIDTGKGGYYSCIEADDYRDKTPPARILQAMINGSAERQQATNTMRKLRELEAEVKLTSIPGYFPTPEAVVNRMLVDADMADGLRILEPSAGSGHIADAIRLLYPNSLIHCIEPNFRLREVLALKNYPVIGYDLMEMEDGGYGYDRILMNPPFEKQQDIDHVRKAYELLRPGGLLVSIMGPGWEYRTDKKSTEFRDWVETVEAYHVKLDAGAFKQSGTGVSTVMVVIPKEVEG